MSEDLLNQLLLSRGIDNAEKREKFLDPKYARDVYDPLLLKGMAEATERIWQAVRDGEQIVIFADYDADGVPGAVVLSEFFRKINYTNFTVYLPNRHTEDYGLMADSVKSFAASGAKLIITIDCGVSNVAEVALAKELGVDVIVTDHHLPPPVLPEAYAVINPKQPADEYPDKMLCGAAVAFKLVQGLIRAPQANFRGFTRKAGSDTDENLLAGLIQWEKTLLDLVAIATVADRVPLVDENRALATFGLMILRRTARPGLNALLSAARLKRVALNEDDIGFVLGPRINSAGRMSHASHAYNLLATRDLAEAELLASELERQNSERKRLVEEILLKVEGAVDASNLPPVIVIGDASWSPGVLGLAASKLVEKFERPVFTWGGAETLKGSCRSDGTVNVVELMRLAGGHDFFSAFGGHEQAGGFSLTVERLAELGERLIGAHARAVPLEPVAESKADAIISIDQVSTHSWNLLKRLAPFGHGNPKPLFLFPNLPIARAKTFGNGGIHLELTFKQSSGRLVCAVGFFTNSDRSVGGQSKFKGVKIGAGSSINLLATIEESFFKASPELRLRIVDIRPTS